MKVWVLGSGSGGNAVLIECEETRILVDAGFGPRTLTTRLRVAGVHPASIGACVITHEHSDHIRGAAQAARKWGWSLHASRGTAASRELADVACIPFDAGDTLALDGIVVETRQTPHDSADPVGLIATSRATGARVGVCYDVGHASDEVHALCREVDVLLLEANHDEAMLRAGPYPYWLQQRISGGRGHLSNRIAGELAREYASAQMAHVVLAHLSEKNNTPDVARRTLARALARTPFRGELTVAPQDGVVGPFLPKGARAAAPMQYSLF